MKIRNDALPSELQGSNKPDYIHDVARYATASSFIMRLKNGTTMDCQEWAKQVMEWEKERTRMNYNDYFGKQTMKADGTKLTNEVASVNYNGQYEAGKIYAKGDVILYYGAMLVAVKDRINVGPTSADGDKNWAVFAVGKPKYMTPPVKAVNTTFYDMDDVCKVTWSDGTYTVVKWDGEDDFNENLAISIAFIKKVFGLKVYDELLDSVDKFEREAEELKEAKRLKLQEEEEKRARAYRKAVKAAVRRRRKRDKFNADVRRELDSEYM